MVISQSLTTATSWSTAASDAKLWAMLAHKLFPSYVNACRWFAGKARQQTGFSVKTVHTLPLSDGNVAYLLILEAGYADGVPENYLLPLSFIPDQTGDALTDIPDKGRIGEVTFGKKSGILVDAIYDERFRQALLTAISQSQVVPQTDGQLTFHRGRGLDEGDHELISRVLAVDSSNSAMVFGNKYF